MTDADHRRLTVWLGFGLAPLAALLAALALGVGRTEPAPPPVAATRSAPPDSPTAPGDADTREAYAATWRSPVFSRDRQPDPADQPVLAQRAAPGPDGLVLTGVILTPSLQLALLKDARGNAFSLARGSRLPGGWTLDAVAFDHAEFSVGDRRQALRLIQARAPLGTADGRAMPPAVPPLPSVAPPSRSSLSRRD